MTQWPHVMQGQHPLIFHTKHTPFEGFHASLLKMTF